MNYKIFYEYPLTFIKVYDLSKIIIHKYKSRMMGAASFIHDILTGKEDV